jgi:hypothetical protein
MLDVEMKQGANIISCIKKIHLSNLSF